jgi:nicotinate-nucleotide pyrophosphorylase (carboxylating)
MIKDYALRILKESLRCDVGFGDITTELIIPKDLTCKGVIKSKEECIVCGLDFVVELFKSYDIECKPLVKEGDLVHGDILEVYGDARTILILERTVLNFLMHLSGIATKTYNVIKKVRQINKDVRIACTRKTLPMLSILEKYAVSVGGGDTHRFRLDDCVMIKDNHIVAVGIEKAFERIKKVSFTKKIEVEVDNLEQLKEVLKYKPDIVLLDNFKPEEVGEALGIIDNYEKEHNHRPIVEVSGGIKEDNVLDYAKYNVDVISMGCLIHSARAVDISLDVDVL